MADPALFVPDWALAVSLTIRLLPICFASSSSNVHSIPSVIDSHLLFPRLRPENHLQGSGYIGLGSRSDDGV
jgi:hypothetical protein